MVTDGTTHYRMNQVYYYAGSYTEYEADRKKRLGNKEPTRLKYAALAWSLHIFAKNDLTWEAS